MAGEYTHPTLSALGTLREKLGDNPAYQSDIEQVTEWEKQVKDLVAREELAGSEKMKEIVAEYKSQVEAICGRLLTEDSTKLPEAQRDRLLDEKKLYEGFIVRFQLKEIRAAIETVDKEVHANIEGIQ